MFICLVLCVYFSKAQITTRELPQKKEVSKSYLYDSTCFWYHPFNNSDEIKKYIGQSIYILPFSKKYVYYPYDNFYTSPNENFNAKINSFANNYLTILDASGEGNMWMLKLLYNNKDTIYYINDINVYDRKTEFIPFILASFFEKSKKEFINEVFVVNNKFTTTDAITGLDIELTIGDYWECVDVALVDLDMDGHLYDLYKPMLVFRNTEGNEIFVNYVKYISEIWKINNKDHNTMNYYYSVNTADVDDFSTLECYELELNKKIDKEIQKEEEQKIRAQKRVNQKRSIIQKFGMLNILQREIIF